MNEQRLEPPIQPGLILLMGSGETAPSAQKIFHRSFAAIADRGDQVRMAVLETPAGFEPNSGYVAEQVVRFVQKRLQNFAPQVFTVPARRRGGPHSTDDPQLAARLYDANVLFMGPGSPTYAARHLQGSLVWETARACHRLGAALILSSAGTLAASRHTLPVYEIYKVGADLHWAEGLDFFAAFGLHLVLVSHWNNGDGGSVLDTSRCYLGQERFAELLKMLPGGMAAHTLVGVDESTALAIDPARELCTVVGVGGVTVQRGEQVDIYAAGDQFPVQRLGPFRLPPGMEGLDPAVVGAVRAGRAAAEAARSALPVAGEAVLALLGQREEARARRDWAGADRLRDQIAAHGWRVLDTAGGQRLEPL